MIKKKIECAILLLNKKTSRNLKTVHKNVLFTYSDNYDDYYKHFEKFTSAGVYKKSIKYNKGNTGRK